jgi:uncharacterized membrane protein (DUF4010 family)
MSTNSDFAHFILTFVFSFLIGLELKAYRSKFYENNSTFFIGTTRTYTFIGIIGFIFYKIDSVNLYVYISGLFALTFLYGIFFNKLLDEKRHSIVLFLVMLIVYSFAPIIILFPLWMSSLIFIVLIFVLNAKKKLFDFNLLINTYEFETLGKMLLLSAVILPLLPKDTMIPYLGISFYKIWLTVVVISGISYTGYLVQKYLFPSKGLFLTGLIGGTYSSTATTVVLSKKARTLSVNHIITASIIAATSMMYIRLLVVSFIFNVEVSKILLIPFLLLILFSILVSFFYYRKSLSTQNIIEVEDKNPLELGTAFIFAFLFIVMMLITNFVVLNYGSSGLKLLSSVVGFSDIDPFVLSLLTGKYEINSSQIASAIVIASGSNNILKGTYTLWFGTKEKTFHSFVWLIILGISTILLGVFIIK